MRANPSTSCTAFAGTELVASGSPADVARPGKALLEAGDLRPLLIFDDATAEPVEIDFRGSMQDVLDRLPTGIGTVAADATAVGPEATPAARAPGRPKLGVVGREVTLLPRHWEWLNAQPGGASVALRKLVEHARRANEGRDRVRRAQEVAFRFMSAMAGNEAGFEEASRALFAGDRQRFVECIALWPADIGDYAAQRAADAFADESSPLQIGGSDRATS